MISTGANGSQDHEISYSQFMNEVDQSKVHDVTIIGSEAHGVRNDKSQFHLVVPNNDQEMYKNLRAKGVDVKLKDNQGTQWSLWLVQLSPVILLGVLWFIMIRQMQTGGNKALSFGKSRARLLSMQQK